MRQAVKSEGRRCNSAKVRRRKIHPRQMLEKSRNAVFSRSFKNRAVKAAGAESGGQGRNQKLHAAVAKSTVWSENVQNTSGPKHFLLFPCRKNARRCGEKHILKWKCTKHVSSEALLAVLLSKKCTPLWRKSTFGSENVQNTSVSEHFLTFWCRKIVRRCGEKQIS